MRHLKFIAILLAFVLATSTVEHLVGFTEVGYFERLWRAFVVITAWEILKRWDFSPRAKDTTT